MTDDENQPSLSVKQARFVAEYLIDLNATQAAIRAGYSEKTAKQQGARLLTNADVLAAVQAGQREIVGECQVCAERVVTELGRIGFSDLRRAFTDEGGLRNPAAWDDATAASISSIKVVTRKPPGGGEDAEVEYITEVKLWDKNSALEKLGKYFGMFREQLDVNVSTDLAEAIAAGRRRAAERNA